MRNWTIPPIAIVLLMGMSACRKAESKPDSQQPQSEASPSQIEYEVMRKEASPSGEFYFEISGQMEGPSLPVVERTVRACRLTIRKSATGEALKEYKQGHDSPPCQVIDWFYVKAWVSDSALLLYAPAFGAAESQYTLTLLQWKSGEATKLGWVTEAPFAPNNDGIAFGVLQGHRFYVRYEKSDGTVQIIEHRTRSADHTMDFFSRESSPDGPASIDDAKAHLVASFPSDAGARMTVDIDQSHVILKSGETTHRYNIVTGNSGPK